jgi:hypothetical protein
MNGGTERMIESSERVQDFKQEIADMKVRDPATGRDRVWLRLGVALMIVGVLLAIFSYFMSHGTNNPLEQNDALTVGLTGVATAVVGSALFLRYSLAAFLRFWLARFVYEQQAQTDRVVEKLER